MMLSVLIPTTPDREEQCVALVQEFYMQARGIFPGIMGFHLPAPSPDADISGIACKDFEVLVYSDEKLISVGEKRDRMYRMAKGKYSVQWDSDDMIAGGGLRQIMNVISENPDTITYEERVTIDGVRYKSNFSLSYPDWEGDGSSALADGFHFHRTPFFKTVIRTDYCRHIGVADERYGEDHVFSRLIKPMLRTEVHINKEIYLYERNSTPHNERYGIVQ